MEHLEGPVAEEVGVEDVEEIVALVGKIYLEKILMLIWSNIMQSQ